MDISNFGPRALAIAAAHQDNNPNQPATLGANDGQTNPQAKAQAGMQDIQNRQLTHQDGELQSAANHAQEYANVFGQ